MDINTIKITSETLSPKQYLELSEYDRANIETTKIVPPSLGGNNFGTLTVSYRIPVYRMGNE